MSTKTYNEFAQSQIRFPVSYPASVRSYGATHPVFVEGDTPGSPTGAYMDVVRGASGYRAASGMSGFPGYTGVTGTYIVRTKDPFAAVVSAQATVQLAAASQGDYTVVAGPKILHADGTWSVPFVVKLAGVNTDIPSGPQNQLNFTLVLRNSQLRP